MLGAIDLGEESDQIIRAAFRFAGAKPEEILLLHVVWDLESMLGPYVCRKPLTELQADLAIDGKSQLQRLVRECGHDTSAVREIVLTGVPWSEIVEAARRHRSDIIVIGARTDEKPSHRLLGSTVSRVMREAPCPVVVIPPSVTRTTTAG